MNLVFNNDEYQVPGIICGIELSVRTSYFHNLTKSIKK